MLSPELGEIYSIVGGAALVIALVGGYKFGRDTSSTTWRNVFLIGGGVFAVMLIADVAFGIVPPSPKTVETPKPAPVKVEQPKPPPTPPKVLNLGMTFEQFKAAYRTNALALGGVDYNLENAVIKSGDVQDVFQCNISQNVVVQGSIDKASGLLKETWILCQIATSNDALDAVIAYGLIMSVLSPELTAEQRNTLIGELKLNTHIEDLATAKVQRVVGNVKYTADYLPQGFFTFAASAKDL